MSFNEIAQLLGNLGAFIGSIAIVVTLIYLAIQVRQAKEQIIHSSQITRGEAAQRILASISDSPYIAPIMAKIGGWSWSDFKLDNVEDNIRFNAWCYAWWRTEEMNFRTYSVEQLATQEQLIMAWLAAWGSPFWPENRAIFDEDFTEVVDRMYKKVQSTEKENENIQSKR